MEGISYPVEMTQIKEVEKMNPHISVSVYALEDQNNQTIVPLRISTNFTSSHHISLLLIKSSEGKTQYILINDMSRLIWKTGTKKKYACRFCLSVYT